VLCFGLAFGHAQPGIPRGEFQSAEPGELSEPDGHGIVRHFARITAAYDPRVMQIALKLLSDRI
jgi:hypothetical protein